ncbi:HigA family addiction module antidote protein [Martelella alba]|uniref:HigA family addiction module antidote protein n=1 Tax=Martelella alba TaxID=2590451 RepID=A0A506TYG2_9HYPH|nr:HigA family addiction module antitoxin [Martelella alba]TPW26356.1 HigA family addiction module antidote protein [Martelella alba]
MTNIITPVHPGEILREDYMAPLGMTAAALAETLRVPQPLIEQIAAEQTTISADIALRLAQYFRTSPEFWLNLQASHDIMVQAAAMVDEIEAIRQIEVV